MEAIATLNKICKELGVCDSEAIANPSKLSNEAVNHIAEAVVEKAAEDVGVRDIMIGSAMGKGAIPLYGRETRKEPCACCLIDLDGPNSPENRMCTTKGAIGILSDREEREWCSEIKIVSDGRCARARSIREAARECKEKYPEDTEAFFQCYIPAFSQITKGSNPIGNPIPEYRYYYCANTASHSNNEVIQVKTDQENPKCPYCGGVMTYGRYWGPLLATQISAKEGMIHRGTDPEAIKVAEKLGLTFDGMMEDLYQLTVAKGPEKAKGITFYVKDLSQVESKLAEKFKEFGIQEGNPGMAALLKGAK